MQTNNILFRMKTKSAHSNGVFFLSIWSFAFVFFYCCIFLLRFFYFIYYLFDFFLRNIFFVLPKKKKSENNIQGGNNAVLLSTITCAWIVCKYQANEPIKDRATKNSQLLTISKIARNQQHLRIVCMCNIWFFYFFFFLHWIRFIS